MIHAADEALQVLLTPDDADSAQMAGVQFARTLAGAPSAAFMLALGEQEQLVRAVLTEAGFSKQTASTAADAFEVGARLEWQRIAPVVQGAMSRA